jgi:hypothetical protein
MDPSIIAAALGTSVIAGLAAVDWYVWGVASKADLRDVHVVRPLTMRELAARLLGGVAATNGEVLMVPSAVAPSTTDAFAAAEEHDHRSHGFKKVA